MIQKVSLVKKFAGKKITMAQKGILWPKEELLWPKGSYCGPKRLCIICRFQRDNEANKTTFTKELLSNQITFWQKDNFQTGFCDKRILRPKAHVKSHEYGSGGRVTSLPEYD